MSVINEEVVKKYFEQSKPRLEKGQDAVASGHLLEVKIDRALGVLFGKVQASQKQKSYTVKAFFNATKISFAECTCPIGEHGQCHHIAAVLDYASKNISSTDTQCMWAFKTKVGNENEGLPIDTFYPPSKPDYQAIPGPLSPEEIQQARTRLASCKGAAAAVKWFTDPEPKEGGQSTGDNTGEGTVPSIAVASIEEAVNSPGFSVCQDKLQFKQFFNLSWTDIEAIAKATEDQDNCPLWHVLHKHRITASCFGKAIRASSNRRSCVSLFQQVSGTKKDLGNVHSVQFGKDNEPMAVQAFCNLNPNKTVERAGLYFDVYGIAGASPDRLCCDDAVIEVKCLWSLRNATNLKEELKADNYKNYIIHFDKDDNYTVNTNHDYYHQIQGQMHLAKRSFGYLVLWIPHDKIVVPMEKENFGQKQICPRFIVFTLTGICLMLFRSSTLNFIFFSRDCL